MRITIIGAGVAGLTIATELCKKGHEVSIIARSTSIGQNSCSWYAGGMLAPWCEGESAEEPIIRLGSKAIDWWSKHVDCVVTNGTLVLTHQRDLTELRRFARRTSHFDEVNAEKIAELEPDLGGRFRQGLYFAQEGHLNPRKALQQLAQRLIENGVDFQLGKEADIAAINADQIIDCRGLSARNALPKLRGVKGEMLIIRSNDIELSRPIRLLHPRIPLYIVPRGDGIFMVGATMLESDATHGLSVRSTLELLSAAYALHPALGEAEILETGVDARPAFSDNLPRLIRQENIIYANGLYRHGFLLSPALAEMTAKLVEQPDYRPEFMGV